ncbi:MAG: glucose-1-phosphate thymidylyltransferase RfbA [Anaerolineales bacterium]|nr:glucose-1-phosphate thymidylyltransferase RfbA [Anaerolineales bacterium]
MKGIILAGGKGSRLYPLTMAASKQMMPVYDKPMIYYPLSALMLAGIREILIISTAESQRGFQQLLGDGRKWGLRFAYAIQEEPRGLADAFLVGKAFIHAEPVCLILGDNIFFGHGLPEKLRNAAQLSRGAHIFAYRVSEPRRYGVIEFDPSGTAISLEEKPTKPRSSYAVPGIYFYDSTVVEKAETLRPSARGELEITDLNRVYLERSELQVTVLGRGIAWLDAGTHESLLQAAGFIQAVQDRQGMMISSPEEIAFRMNYITGQDLRQLADSMGNNHYSAYLRERSDEVFDPWDRGNA